MTFEELKDALILISYDAVDTEDENDIYHTVLPYTFEDGNLVLYDLNGEVDVDNTIKLEDYNVAMKTPYDINEFATVNDLLIKILLTEGKEIIREAPFNEEEVVDNRITLTLYDASRKKILSRTRTIGKKRPKPVREPEKPLDIEDIHQIVDTYAKARRSLCISGWRLLGFHFLLLLIAGSLSLWLLWGFVDVPWVKWVFSCLFGIYFTQIWWNNARRSPIFIAWPLEIRAKERPWINGGLITGLVVGILFFCIPSVEAEVAFILGILTVYIVTPIWFVYHKVYKEEWNILTPALNNLKRSNRRMARKNFFSNMFDF